ncbi:MAG: site-specific integrase [Prevotellaceae bacterium]|nr:site-specific integrase [Prevotellaceae bacterium]
MTDFIYEYLSKSARSMAYKRQYRNIARHVRMFSDVSGIIINTNSFTEQVMEEFVAYLRSKNLMMSTIRNIRQKVSAMINKAEKRGYLVERGFENVVVKTEDSCAIYLTVDELKRLNELKSLSKQAQAVRDRFLVGCFTALRISDYRRLTVEDNFNFDKGFIQIKTQKTGVVVTIPIHPIIYDVLKRNKNVLPVMPTQQAFGKTIKRICKKAGIADEVLWERTVGARVVRKKVKKYQLISSHTARRSGATNMYLAGITTARIMLLTGHQTEQAFFRYIRIAREENAKTLSEHDFLKKNL